MAPPEHTCIRQHRGLCAHALDAPASGALCGNEKGGRKRTLILNNTGFDRPASQRGGAMQIELHHEVLAVLLHCLNAQFQDVSDLFVGVAFGD